MFGIRRAERLFLFTSIFTVIIIVNSAEMPVSWAKLATCQEYDINWDGVHCPHYFELADLKNYKSDQYKLRLKFYVMASTDANVVLWNGKTGKDKVEYIAVIGGHSNTYSWFRINDMTVGLDSNKPRILSPLWPVPIEVRQNYCGEVELAVPGVIDPIIKGPALDLETAKVCVYAWSTQSRWFYNCDENTDVLSREARSCTKSNPRLDSFCRCDTTIQ